MQGLEGGAHEQQVPLPDHTEGLRQTFQILRDRVSTGITDEVRAIGHRVVHGGTLKQSVVLDEASKAEVLRAAVFAPLHNKSNLKGVEACAEQFPGRTQVRWAACVSVRAQQC